MYNALMTWALFGFSGPDGSQQLGPHMTKCSHVYGDSNVSPGHGNDPQTRGAVVDKLIILYSVFVVVVFVPFMS
jgi:hypothetical protein